ncbi:MAG: AAA family ATPase [Rhodospirillales bacterium]|nr:AAA family ATPase [Rhodospirillales bacterium]
MPDVATQPKTALEIILEWSRDRPAWQRDALRRIVQGRKLAEADFAELTTLCKRGRTERPPEGEPEPEPLEASHLPANPGAGASVALLTIKDVLAVNQLAPDQTLSFAAKGITVVYGDNGAGKSGYARLLKRACRARHSEVILPNVYAGSAAAKASATLCYSIGGTAREPEAWQDTGKPAPQPHPVLSAVSVFDADCAAVHLKDKNPVAFRPFGLDVPDELGAACKQLKTLLDAEKKQQEGARNAIFAAPPWKATTAAGKAVAALTHKTSIPTLEKLATLTAPQQARLTQLTEDLSKNPATAAAEQKLKADRIKRLAAALTVIAASTADDVLTRLLALHSDAVAKRDAARLAAQGLFGTDSLPEVGGKVWRTLWEAARRYSTETAYPAAPFPPAEPDALCVLCQQPLSDEAVRRMNRFESFIRDDTERHAQEAEAAFAVAGGKLDEVAISLRPIAESLKEVALRDPVLSQAIRRALASARLRRYVARRRIAGVEAAVIPPAEPFPAETLAAMEADVRKYAADLEKAATGDERKALEAERQELADRALLNTHMPAIRAEIERLKAIRFLDDCLADTATNAITKLGNDIADQVLTPRLRDRFSAEIIGLVGVNIRAEMVRAGGQYGSPHYQIRLLAKPDAKLPDILSEGEQTCVAIAAFLAELATAPHSSALVFDDPITSLDHKWRHRVAERLVAEAAIRQVIVFTHDLIFLNDIMDAAHNAGCPCEARHIRRSAAVVGMVNSDLPWEGMKVLARVDALQKQARALMLVRTQQDEETYKREAKHFYDDLRTAWERALEEVAFADVVMRHRDYIKGKDLVRVSALIEQDCQTWTDNFRKCSGYVAAHDESRGRNRAMPEPEALLRDVETLDTWVRDLKARQQAVQTRSTGTPPVAAVGE